jgi:hypothetical protein
MSFSKTIDRSARFGFAFLAIALIAAWSTGDTHADSGVTGRVAGQTKQGKYVGMVPGATIEILEPGGEVAATTTSNPRGMFKVDLPPGRYYYRLKAEGYKDEDAGRGFEVKTSDRMEIFHFALTTGENDPDRVPVVIPESIHGTLAGRVLQRTDEGDVGIERAKITLVNEATRQVEEVNIRPGMSSTGLEGSYRVTLPEGSWRASVRAPRFDRFIDPEPIRIMAGRTATRDFVLRRYDPPEEMLATQGIRGEVLIDKGGRTYPPPFNVQLVAKNTSDGAGVGSALTEIGEQDFSINTMPGSYRVEATPADEEFATALSRSVFVFPGRDSTVRIVLRQKPLEVELAETDVLQPEIDIAETEMDQTTVPDLPGDEAQLGPQPEPPDLEITALDRRTKKPLAETEILLREVTDQKATVIRGRTDTDGIATFKIPAGQYFVVARLAGFDVVAAMPQQSFLRGRLVLNVSAKEQNRATFVLDRHREPEITPRQGLTASGAVMFQSETALGTALIEGARLTWSGPITQTTTSGSLGAYSVALARGTYNVTVVPPAGSDYESRTFTRVVAKEDFTRNFVLRRKSDVPVISPQVQVNVFDERTRRPIPGARVSLQRAGSGGATAASGTTTPTGQVTLGLRTAGDYLANVNAPGYIPRRMEVTATAGRISVLNAAMQSSGEPLEPGGPSLVTVNGWVVTPRFASRGPSGGLTPRRPTLTPRRPPLPGESTPDWGLVQPVANADVLWYFPNEGRLPGAVRTVRTNSKGRFTIEGIRENNYPVVVRATGYNELSSRVSVRESMRDPVLTLKPRDADTPLTPSATKTLVKLTVMTVGSRPTLIPGAQITIKGNRDAATGTSDRSGRFITQLAPGQYSVQVSHGKYQSGSLQMTVASSAVNRQVQLTPRDATTPGGKSGMLSVLVMDQSRRPVAGAKVEIIDAAQASFGRAVKPIRTGTTASSGRYQTSLASGKYNLRVSGTGFRMVGSSVVMSSVDQTKQIQVVRSSIGRIIPGRTIPGVETPSTTPSAQSQFQLTIQVRDQTQKGVGGATVTVMRGNQTVKSGRTDASGYYRTTVAPGVYAVKASGSMITTGGSQVAVQNRNVNSTVNVNRTSSSSGIQRSAQIKYLAQFRAPGSTVWTTIGSFDSRQAAELKLKATKVPPKSATRVVPQTASPIRRGIQIPQRRMTPQVLK